MDDIIVQVNFKADTYYGEFRDALNMPITDYECLSQDEIDDMKKMRVDNHVAFMDNLKLNPTPPPTKAELQAQAASITSRISELNTQKSELNSKIAGM